ncbi:MAG: PAS domain S-box protein [Acidiferrobacterales bacterium]
MYRYLAPRDKKLIAQLAVVAALSLVSVYLVGRYAESVFLRTESEAASVRMANFLSKNLSDLDNILGGGSVTEADRALFEHAAHMGGVFRYKLFNADGQIVHASRPTDIGRRVSASYFDTVVRQGESYFSIAYRPIGTTAYTDELGTPYEEGVVLVSERYVPIVDNAIFRGALEVYIDMTPLLRRLRGVTLGALAGVSLLLVIVGLLNGVFIYRNLIERRQRIRELETARHKAENLALELREGAARAEAIINNVVDGVITVDESGAIESFNPTAERVFGYAASEVIGKRFDMLLEEDRCQEYNTYITRDLNQESLPGGRYQYDEFGRYKDGTIFPIELVASKLVLQGRRLLVHIARDISERRRAEKRLRLAASVFDNTTEGILITDHRGSIEFVNPAFTAITGYRSEEVIGKNPRVLQSGRQNKHFYEKMWESIKDTGHWQGEIYNRRKNGEIYPQWLTISAIRDHRGSTMNYVGVTWDITELKASERIKDEFIATVSHELRTPLTSIHGSLGLILGGVAGRVSAKAQNLIQIAHGNSERLVRLINDILDIAKMEAGKMRFHLRPLDLTSIIDQAIETNQGLASQYGVRISVEQSVPGATVVGDSDRLMQVFTNLLSNAVKYGPRDSEVYVSVTRNDGGLRVAVTDRGSGIPEHFRDKVFRKFAQADASDAREKGGTGLGLSISQLIVERLGGRIDYYSEPGTATTFYFELPELRKESRQTSTEKEVHRV